MPWKVDEESGSLVVDEETNNPVWVSEDGKEVPFDADRANRKIHELNTESAGRRKELERAQGKLRVLDGIDNPEEYLEQATEALEKIRQLDDKELLDAGKVDELKAQIREAYEGKLKEKDKAIETAEQRLTQKEREISDYMIGNEFARSSFVGEKTVLPPDIAQTYFGRYFQVEEGRVTGRWPDTGEPIYSDTQPGEVASFDEAVQKVINRYPGKDKILRDSGATGIGTTGSGSKATASKWGHIKAVSDFRSPGEKSAYISEVGLGEFKKLPASRE